MLSMTLILNALTAAAPAEVLPTAADFEATFKTAPPNIIFLLDRTDEMGENCWGASCLDRAIDIIGDLADHTDWARIGVATTALSATDDSFVPVAPLGTSRDALRAALEDIDVEYGAPRNLAEALSDMSVSYLSEDQQAICADCQETWIITLTAGRPHGDAGPPSWTALNYYGLDDVRCDSEGNWLYAPAKDQQCYYDNVVRKLYTGDHRNDLLGTQRVVTHTISLGRDMAPTTDDLFWNAAEMTNWEGIYWRVYNPGELEYIIGWLMEIARNELVATSAPTISVDGDRLLYAYYEREMWEPMALGHLRAYALGSSADEAEHVLYEGSEELGGALWDAGELLADRPAYSGEYNENDRDGEGKRDIYTYIPELTGLPAGEPIVAKAIENGRVSFDRGLVSLLAKYPDMLDLFVDIGAADGASDPWDLNMDWWLDKRDLQAMVDFIRGASNTEYRYLWTWRGDWKLGAAPTAPPTVVRPRAGNFASDPTYRRFLRDQEEQGEGLVLLPANDGLLHAFSLDTGEELWAWVPSSLLYQDPVVDWGGQLSDLMRYGQVSLFEGTPVVEDVWIDADGDGMKRCNSLPDDCEWRRVVVVTMGRGGSSALALDITDPTAPEFLWEEANVVDPSAGAYAVSRPAVVNMVTMEDGMPADTWTALWGSGRAPLVSMNEDGPSDAEGALHMRALADGSLSADSFVAQALASRFDVRGSNFHPDAESGLVDPDGDMRYEYGSLSGAPAAVDIEGDGDVDVIYLALHDARYAGTSSLYKLILSPETPDEPEWCLLDTLQGDDGSLEMYYSPTVARMTDGTLGIYLGAGTPFDNSRDRGAFVALHDPMPMACVPAEPICGSDGVLDLDNAERLTTDPIVFDGVVYFSTWIPDESGCGRGEGRIYGMSWDTCEAALDVDEDGHFESYLPVWEYPSSMVVSGQGTLYYALSNPDLTRVGENAVGELRNRTDPFGRTRTLMLGEIF
jgi:hypothetical protein